MFCYILFLIALIYFFIILPITTRIVRHRLARKFGLHDETDICELFLTKDQKKELINYLVFTDALTFSKIAKSNHFYLVKERNSELSLYCCLFDSVVPINYDAIKKHGFIRLNIEDKKLILFLKEVLRHKEVRE